MKNIDDLENFMLSEINQTQRTHIYDSIYYICNIYIEGEGRLKITQGLKGRRNGNY